MVDWRNSGDREWQREGVEGKTERTKRAGRMNGRYNVERDERNARQARMERWRAVESRMVVWRLSDRRIHLQTNAE